jgi:competence protein ComEC
VLGTCVALSPCLIGAILLTAGALLLRWSIPHAQRCCRWFFIGLLLAHLHVLWQAQALPLEHVVHLLSAQPAHPMTVEGTLERAVEAHGDRQRVYLRLQRLQEQQDWRPVTGLVRLNVYATDLPFLPGDVVRVTRLRLHPVHGFFNPGSLDIQGFLHQQGIYALGGVSDPARLSLQQRPAGFVPARMIEHWRRFLHTRVSAYLPPPYDAIFLAMVLGHRGKLTAPVEDSFRKSGTTHLLVASGLNVGFIAAVFLFGWRTLLRPVRSWLPRAWLPGWRPTPVAILLSLPTVVLYCSVVGWEVPTTRAALMVGSYMLALALGRQRDLLYTLILAAALILLVEPTAIFSLSFQLSFGAVAGILLAARHLPSPWSAPSPMRRWGRRLRAYVVTSSAAYLSTLPILAGAFHTLPTFGIPANLLLVPPAGALVPAGVLALGAVVLWPALGTLVFMPFAWLLTWMLAITERFASLPGAQLHLAAPSVPMLIGYYGLLGSLLCWPWPRWRRRFIGGCVVLLLAGVGWQYLGTRVQQLHVTFLDVGSGDSIFVQVPGNHYLLIDGGGTHDGRFDIGAQVVAPVLWDRYVRRLDFMAMTHPQTDHARGLASLIGLFPPRHLLTNGTPLTANYLRELVVTGNRLGTQQHTALDGPHDWHWERLHLTVLAPPSTTEQQHTLWTPPTENDRSLVLRLQYGATRILLTGDIQHATERWLLAHRPDLHADILQVPHHGSRTSTLPAFVQRVAPQVGIISLGAGNSYGHPHPRVLQVLAQQQIQVFRTDQHGAITITSDGTQYRVVPFRPYRPPLPTR